MTQPTTETQINEAILSKLQRRDPRPEDEKRVRVRLTVLGSYHDGEIGIDDGVGDFEPHDRWPLMVARVERECWEGHAKRLRSMVEKHAPTEAELEAALRDFRQHLKDVAVSDAPDAARDGIRRKLDAMTGPELLTLVQGHRVSGKTHRPFRPAFAASFVYANARDLFPVLAVEVL